MIYILHLKKVLVAFKPEYFIWKELTRGIKAACGNIAKPRTATNVTKHGNRLYKSKAIAEDSNEVEFISSTLSEPELTSSQEEQDESMAVDDNPATAAAAINAANDVITHVTTTSAITKETTGPASSTCASGGPKGKYARKPIPNGPKAFCLNKKHPKVILLEYTSVPGMDTNSTAYLKAARYVNNPHKRARTEQPNAKEGSLPIDEPATTSVLSIVAGYLDQPVANPFLEIQDSEAIKQLVILIRS
ncbi:hypothetical protein JR316_0013305 [Psilocybe cubensis]|uniref:Uncharacterized protein n=2 Tax=Psilocybe cubensis TaxID=181762 RepID=A0A8H7XUW3_PSICU|nr:hypothetical protein JR316_0013305 [Psilocybe cubensis]KAH9474839.1 hypothetical protein JR316_0013305 [Psilocybe cubensis]